MTPDLFDRALLARARSRAFRNQSLPSCDFLLRHVTQDVVDRLSLITREFEQAFNYGAHLPFTTDLLKRGGQVKRVISSDHVLELAQQFSPPAVVANEEFFPFQTGRFDLIVSLLQLQWINDLPGALHQIRKGLKDDGVFIAATLGGDSLCELRHCLIAAEEALYGGSGARVAPFADVRDLGHLLQRAEFSLPVTDRDVLTVRYQTVWDLMADLRAMGAANVLRSRPRRPVSRRFFNKVNDLYREQFSDEDGRLRATFEIIYLMGWAPHPDQQKPLRPGSGAVSLTDVFEKKK